MNFKLKIFVLALVVSVIVAAIVVPSVLLTKQDHGQIHSAKMANSTAEMTDGKKPFFSTTDLKVVTAASVGTAGIIAGGYFTRKTIKEINMDAYKFERLSEHARNRAELDKTLDDFEHKVSQILAEQKNYEFKVKAINDMTSATVESLSTALSITGSALGGVSSFGKVADSVADGAGSIAKSAASTFKNIRIKIKELPSSIKALPGKIKTKFKFGKGTKMGDITSDASTTAGKSTDATTQTNDKVGDLGSETAKPASKASDASTQTGDDVEESGHASKPERKTAEASTQTANNGDESGNDSKTDGKTSDASTQTADDASEVGDEVSKPDGKADKPEDDLADSKDPESDIADAIGERVQARLNKVAAELTIGSVRLKAVHSIIKNQIESYLEGRAAEISDDLNATEVRDQLYLQRNSTMKKLEMLAKKFQPQKNLKVYQAAAGSGFAIGTLSFAYAGLLSFHRTECLRLVNEEICEKNMYCFWKGNLCAAMTRFGAAPKYNELVCAVQTKETCGKQSVSAGCAWRGEECTITVYQRLFGSLNRYWIPPK